MKFINDIHNFGRSEVLSCHALVLGDQVGSVKGAPSVSEQCCRKVKAVKTPFAESKKAWRECDQLPQRFHMRAAGFYSHCVISVATVAWMNLHAIMIPQQPLRPLLLDASILSLCISIVKGSVSKTQMEMEFVMGGVMTR